MHIERSAEGMGEHTDWMPLVAPVAREGMLCCLGVWRGPEALPRRVEGHRAWYQGGGESHHYVCVGDVVRKRTSWEGHQKHDWEGEGEGHRTHDWDTSHERHRPTLLRTRALYTLPVRSCTLAPHGKAHLCGSVYRSAALPGDLPASPRGLQASNPWHQCQRRDAFERLHMRGSAVIAGTLRGAMSWTSERS